MLLVLALVASRAHGQPPPGARGGPWPARARGVPTVLFLLPPEPGIESPAIPVRAGPEADPNEAPKDAPKVEPTTRDTHTPQHLMVDTPLSAGAWVAYGTSALVPVGGVIGASRLGGERLWVTAAQTAAGSVVGSVPGGLLFLQPPEAGGRWTDLDVAAFGVGMVLTPPVAALGTWGLGELAFHGSQDRGRAFVGALGGAAVGMLLGVVTHGVLEEVVGNRETLRGVRKAIALGFIGSGATLGYQWAGGGPRPRER